VVTIGTRFHAEPKLPIAGKTGTAEFGSSAQDSAGRNKLGFHNWFVLVPAEGGTTPIRR